MNYFKRRLKKMIEKKKKQPEASDADDSFDYDQGFNIEEVYDQ